jgi:hypothetical protein
VTELREIALLRLAAQQLAGPGAGTATGAVRWLVASQAQDHASALAAVALRTNNGTRPDVESARKRRGCQGVTHARKAAFHRRRRPDLDAAPTPPRRARRQDSGRCVTGTAC